MARTLLLGLAAAAIPILSAAAAPATPEEAGRLTTLFERYVGHPAPGEPGSVTVVPKGESYVATLDLKRALSGMEGLGFTLDPIALAGTLTPLPDGTWKVTSSDGPPLTLHIGPQTVSLTTATSSLDGIYDPKLYAFTGSRQEQTGYDYTQTAPSLVQHRRADKVSLDLTGRAAEGGGVDMKGHYRLVGTSADVTVKPAPDTPAPGNNPAVPPPPRPATTFASAAPTGAVDVGLDGFRAKDLLDLWAFLVAHPDRNSLSAAQDDLKALLKAGLPYLGAIKESASFDSPTLTTSIGTVSMKALGASLDAEGLAGTGKVTTALSVADLAVPPGQLPPWSAGLVPTGLDLHVALDGFHAAAAAIEAVNDVDLKKDVVITPEQKTVVSHLFWPGAGTVTLQPSRLTTRALDLRMDGQGTMGPQPSGRVTITATGLDKEIAALQAQAATDPGAGQVLSPLVLAKNLAKPNPDGSLLWVIEFGSGPVRINGATLQ